MTNAAPNKPTTDTVAVRFVTREPPLVPVAALARGVVAERLVQSLMARPEKQLEGLRGVGAAGVVVVTGEVDALPWVDGIEYLGRDAEAPSLLLPTRLAPTVAAALLERALLSRAAGAAVPLAVLPSESGAMALVPLGGARPIDRASLEAWLAKFGRRTEETPP